jgi:hypothetical protein
MVTKLDLKKDLKHLYNPSAKAIAFVDVPPMSFLMIDGTGNPNTAPAYQDAMETLYAVSYTLKFMSKADPGIDYTVMPPEGLWWADDMAEFILGRKDNWQWTMMIMQPDHITAARVQAAVEQVRARKKPTPPALDKLRFETYHEGPAAQIMYFGPFADEGPTIARIHAWIEEKGYTYHGAKAHHEIYLSDMRRTAPEKLKTVIRQPVIRVG